MMPSQGTTTLRPCAVCGAATRVRLVFVRSGKKPIRCRPCIVNDDTLITERVRNHLVVGDCGCCRIWPRASAGQYGQVLIYGQVFLVHRLILQAKIGLFPRTEYTCHNCPCGDRKDCAEISHLFKGTTQVNTRDAAAKGMLPRGEKHGMARLTEAQVLSVPQRIANGERHQDIAASLGVSRSAITAINRGENWAHVSLAPAKRPQPERCPRCESADWYVQSNGTRSCRPCRRARHARRAAARRHRE